MAGDPSSEDVAELLDKAGLHGPCKVTALPGGANNRVHRVDCAAATVLLKVYFHDAEDQRDRLGAEFAFSRFAWERGVRCLPRPLAQDSQRHWGLYEFIDGRALTPEDINAGAIEQALAFFRELNQHRDHPAARSLPYGSEACLTLSQHLACVERRLANLGRIDDATPLDRQARRLVEELLKPAWERVRQTVHAQMSADEPIGPADECLSPSDFGFHNAILAADGRLRFLDFEYAGWDDPAKVVCDFFCQPALPVPVSLAESFREQVANCFAQPDLLQRRIALLLPVYRVKWCCIMLNHFLPVGSRRRRFAREEQDQQTWKNEQLERVRQALREEPRTQ